MREVMVELRETWQLQQLLRDYAPEVYRGYPWYNAMTDNWLTPKSENRVMRAPAGTFDDIAERAPDSWLVFVYSLFKSHLPDVDYKNAKFIIDEAPGANKPLQKYLYVKVGDNDRFLLKSFRYFAELEEDEAMYATFMLLVG